MIKHLRSGWLSVPGSTHIGREGGKGLRVGSSRRVSREGLEGSAVCGVGSIGGSCICGPGVAGVEHDYCIHQRCGGVRVGMGD